MLHEFPCILDPRVDGGFVVMFPDVPEAITEGDNRPEALEMAQDGLATALAGYVLGQRSIPVPSPVCRGQKSVSVYPEVAAKIDLYTAMQEQGITKEILAVRLGVSLAVVRRLTNPDRRDDFNQVRHALRVLGVTR